MKTKLTKEIFQQLIIRARGTFAKDIAHSLKNNKFVEVFHDDTLKSQMVFGNEPEGLVKFSSEKGHHLAKVSHIHPKSFKQDIYELDTSYRIIPCEDLIAPTYKKITVKDILNLPRKESDLSLHTLAEGLSSIKISWQEEQRLEDLRLELDTLCEDLKLLRQGDPVLNHNIIHVLEENLLTTYNYAVKLGLSYKLDDI